MSDNGDVSPDGADDGEGGNGGIGDVPPTEKAVMAVSVLLTVSLFAFAAWQSFASAGAVAPTVDVVERSTGADGDVLYTIELRNPGGVGLVQATVEAGCADPPIRLAFENVPSGGRRMGTVVCPPGTTDPRLSVDSWTHG